MSPVLRFRSLRSTFMPVKTINDFLKLEAASGIILMFAAVAAIISLQNSPLSPYYDLLLQHSCCGGRRHI